MKKLLAFAFRSLGATPLLLFTCIFAVNVAQAAPQVHGKKHAIVKLSKLAVSPVTHPKKTTAQILTGVERSVGAFLWLTEPGVDVAYYSMEGADKAAAVELKHNPFHYAFLGTGYADEYWEKAELYLLGKSN